MAGFITRIELHKADENDYEILHREMKKEFFTGLNIYPGRNKGQHLNQVEYIKEGSINLHDVSSATLRAAGKTGLKYSFTIIKKK